MKIFGSAILLLAALGFLAFGLWFLIDPIAPLASMGISLSGAGAPVEIRAFYGGLEIGLAIFLWMAWRDAGLRRAGLWLVLLANAGIGLARVLGLALGEPWIDFFAYALIWEFGFALLAGIALRGEAAKG